MSYLSHPLETEGDSFHPTGRIPTRSLTPEGNSHSHLGLFDDDLWPYDSPFSTVHPLDECRECHAYIKHVDQTSIASDPAVQSYSRPGRTFFDGIEVGRQLQLEENSMYFSRYRSRLQLARKQYEESLLANSQYRDQAELLEMELASVKDNLMALQMAYDDLAMDRPGRAETASWASVEDGHRDLDADLPSFPTMTHDNAEDPMDVWDEGFERFDARRSRSTDIAFDDEEDEDFLALQQIHMMDDRQKEDADPFWSDSHHHASDSESDSYDSWSPPSSLSSSSAELHSSDDSDSDLHHAGLAPPPPETELSISYVATLMEAAHEPGNITALNEVRLLIQDAERTPRKRRTAAQLYLLLTWRSPSRSPSSSPALGSATYLPLSASGSQHGQSSASSSSLRPEIFVDASAYGIGLVFNQQWLAWRFSPGHPCIPIGSDNKPIMSWAELIAVELGILTLLAAGHRNSAVAVRSDNIGVVDALRKRKWTPNYDLEGILQRILNLCDDAGLELRVKWVSTKVNPADKPSRGVFPSRALMFAHSPAIPAHLAGLLAQVQPA